MKRKRCPYCGRRISYGSSFASRRKAEYVCPKCGKESKVVMRRRIVVLVFFAFALVSLGIMAAWILCGLVSNPLGILLVCIPLAIFGIISPNFVKYEPLKKYKKSMEAKKAGIAYSDNLLTTELEKSDNYTFPSVKQKKPAHSSPSFEINADVFNEIKEERNAARKRTAYNEKSGEKSENAGEEGYVSVISSVSEAHASSGAGLKKIRSETSPKPAPARNRHYVNSENTEKPKKREAAPGERYTSNRKL